MIEDQVPAGPGGSATVEEILADKRCSELNRDHFWKALMVFAGSGFVGPATTSDTRDIDIVASLVLDRFICKHAEFTDQMRFLVAPAIGTAFCSTSRTL